MLGHFGAFWGYWHIVDLQGKTSAGTSKAKPVAPYNVPFVSMGCFDRLAAGLREEGQTATSPDCYTPTPTPLQSVHVFVCLPDMSNLT
jgi:hypothetical protein